MGDGEERPQLFLFSGLRTANGDCERVTFSQRHSDQSRDQRTGIPSSGSYGGKSYWNQVDGGPSISLALPHLDIGTHLFTTR